MSTVLGYRAFGAADVQEYFDRPGPVPGPAEVLVRVAAAGVNPLDHLLRSGHVPDLNGHLPFPQVIGMEAAGTVLAAGGDVTGLQVGDRVTGFALTGAGTYAETTLLLGESTARIPDTLPWAWAATIPVAGTTALDVLDQLDLSKGASLLVNGIGGGVGIAVAQLARDRGLAVTGTGSTAKRELAAKHGAAFVDYTAGNVADQLGRFDAVVDTVGGESLRRVAPLAEKLIAVGDPSVTELGGVFVQRRLDRAGLERVAELMAGGRLDPHITGTYPLARAQEALALVESRHASGKLVISI
ncbi:NADP-dependent oxidoreductase [Amycolatopsis rubida]|uniref:NADP-dependent oxidoreductase n=1 Tax=Amycolatopsis rubida TaxID=112413 RepID=A0ABX0C8Y2_9PSEU|nr:MULTISPECIES: NADP-dependent oxidoreductase [Amycolatopsis]MYW96464.1 zinc-binding dehydrogenase [Amycolatopsis rubida]NEC61451.1 NADP-dependent oxidoreductase [Amycolatopsis rubida]OAP28076.1 Phthiocerol synthesis polyketide synthase type I PpsC [Amycolatopsis sp. M39]